MNKLVLALALVAAPAGPVCAEDLRGWDTRREALPPTGACAPPLDGATIRLVEPRFLAWAFQALSQAEAIPLTEARARELTAEPRPAGIDPDARPFLVRAVAGANTGWFQIYACDAGLFVGHGSMSREPPIPSRMPLVLWLMRQPGRVYATWVFAQ